MLARGALYRLAAEVPKQAAHDLPKLASLVQSARAGYSLPIRTLSHASQLQTRFYATETVTNAVKAKAAAGKSVTKTTTEKKPAATKATKKAAPKKAKKKAKKTKAVKKPARKPKKKPAAEVDPKLKEIKAIAKLRKLALKVPVSRKDTTAFHLYIKERATGKDAPKMTEVVKMWKDVSPAEREKWNHLTAEHNEARAAEYKAWVESHTPDEIRLVNNARRLLKKKLLARRPDGKYTRPPIHTEIIKDTRQVKRPRSAWTHFFTERAVSTDFNGIAVPERLRLMGAEWKALNDSERQRYVDMAAADKQRHDRELAAQQTV